MTTPPRGKLYHVFTKRSTDCFFELHIPKGYKVLSGGVRARGATGLLSSFYEPEKERWVVQHEPIDDGASVLLQVVTLVDPDDRYDVAVSVVSMADVVDPEEREKLARQGEYRNSTARATPKSNGTSRDPQTILEEQNKRRHCSLMSECGIVSLFCPVPEGYTLTGGGFTSGYPVLASAACSCDVGGENGSLLHPRKSFSQISLSSSSLDVNASTTVRIMSDVSHSECMMESINRSQLPTSSMHTRRNNNSDSCIAWSVVTAKNISLSCYAIGICPRPILRGVKKGSLPTIELPQFSNDISNTVRAQHKPGGRWAIELPPPHGKFVFLFGTSRDPNPVVLSSFFK